MTTASLVDWLRRSPQAAATAVALEDGSTRLTYAELWSAVDRAATIIARARLSDGPIALVGANSINYLVAAYGGLAAGVTVAEMAHHEPAARLQTILSKLQPSLVICPPQVESVAPRGVPRLDLAQFDLVRLAGVPALPQQAARDPANCAFVVFTSGTTGDPKGVMLSHTNLVAVTEAILDYLPLTPSDRYALVLPLFHTYAKSVVHTTWRRGGTVVLEDFSDPGGFAARLVSRQITAFSGVPYHFNLLLQRVPLGSLDLSALRFVTISGSQMAHHALLRLVERLPATHVHFMYGLTETSTRACALPPERLRDKPGSCGRAIDGVELAIVGQDGHQLPPGTIGEVRIHGRNVMLGYWSEPELTADALQHGGLLTGDLGYLDRDGYLFLVGRKNDLIKCGGERISACEIEAALLSHADVVEAAVAGVPHPVLGESVSAWVVPRTTGLSERELIAHCAARLTHHKIPRSWVFLEQLPKTATGKVQKHLLAGRATVGSSGDGREALGASYRHREGRSR